MAFCNGDGLYIYNYAVQFCKDSVKKSGPQHYLNLFQSLKDDMRFAPYFKYFNNVDAFNFFRSYPQVFIINNDFVLLNVQPLRSIQPSTTIQNYLSNSSHKIVEEKTKVSDMGISPKSKTDSNNKAPDMGISQKSKTDGDTRTMYSDAIKFCQELVKQSGPRHYLNLFQSLMSDVRFASYFKYFNNENAYNFFLSNPQVFNISNSFVLLNVQSLRSIQPCTNIQNNLSNSSHKIEEEQTKASDIGICQKSETDNDTKIYEDIYQDFFLAVSNITEIPQSIKRDLVNSILFLLSSFQQLDLKCAFKTVLYIVKNASISFSDLCKTKKQVIVKAMCKVLSTNLPKKHSPFKPVTDFKKSVLLFATYLLIEKTDINFDIFLKIWEKCYSNSCYSHIPKYEILKVFETSEFIGFDKMNSLSLSSYYEPVNIIVESISKLICISNQNKQELMGITCDIQSIGTIYQDENVFNCPKALHEVQMSSSESSQEEKPKLIKMEYEALCEVKMVSSESSQEEKPKLIKTEHNLPHPIRVSDTEKIVETSPLKENEEEHETYETTQKTGSKFSLDENGEKLLKYSFFTVKKYFEDALPNDIIQSFILASKNVCEKFTILSTEDQLDFLERCICSIKVYGNLSSDSNHNFKKSTLVEERPLIICYLVVKSGGMHYINLLELLRMLGISIKVCEYDASLAKMYFRNVCNYVNLSKKGFLNVKPPFSSIKRSLKDKYDSVFYSKDTLSSQSKQISVKTERDFSDLVRVRKVDNVVETASLKDTEIKLETSERTGVTANKLSFGENEEKLLVNSFIIIRKYFKDALPNHIILSFLLVSKHLCENFAILSTEDQLNFLERCYGLINAYSSSSSDSNYHKLKESTLEEERHLIICYIVIESGGINYRNLLENLKKVGICVQVFEDSVFVSRIYLKNICNFINFSKKGFLTLKPPFSSLKCSLKDKYVAAFPQNHTPSYACANNSSSCVHVANDNVSTEVTPNSSQDLPNQHKDSLIFEVGEKAEKETYSDQVANEIIDISVFILSICEKMHIEQICNQISCSNLKNNQTRFLSLTEHEKLTFFKGFPQYFIVDTDGYVSLKKGVVNDYELQSEIDFSNLLTNSTASASEKMKQFMQNVSFG